MIYSIYWEIKMDLLETARYRFGVISDALIYGVLMMFFIASETGKKYGVAYDYADYAELTVIGYIAWVYASTALVSASHIIRNEMCQGTFYKKCNSRYPLQWFLFGRIIAVLIKQSIVIWGLAAAVYLICNIKITINIFLICVVFISSVGMYGMGLIISGLTLFYKKVGAVLYLAQMLLLFVTDTIPTGAMSRITGIIPLSLCNKTTRLLISGNPFAGWLLRLAAVSAIWLAVGSCAFNYYVKRAKRKGSILFF